VFIEVNNLRNVLPIEEFWDYVYLCHPPINGKDEPNASPRIVHVLTITSMKAAAARIVIFSSQLVQH
jgi:hypothetical protein